MKKFYTLALCAVSLAAIAQPANDEPCNAIEVPVVFLPACTPTVQYSFSAATTSAIPAAPCLPQRPDIWFKFTMTAPGPIAVVVAEGNQDLIAALYSATSCTGTFTYLTCDDNTNGTNPQLNYTATAAGTYYIRIWRNSNSPNTPSFKLCVGSPEPLSPAKVGIGTANPQAGLDVNGTFRIRSGNPGAGKLLTSDATGEASWVAPVPPVTPVTPPPQITAAGNIYGATLQNLPPVANVYSFIGPTVNLTLTANQRVIMNVSTSLGRISPGFAGFQFDLGFRVAGSTAAPQNFFDVFYVDHLVNFTSGQTTIPVSASGSVKPGAGTWQFGPVVSSGTANVLTLNRYVNGTYMVITE